ncbi:MAG TPA: hypothetical protein VMU06_12880 [Stellaceae bacterium]|nr:hypothetical protein [Stellaceae bacterium]
MSPPRNLQWIVRGIAALDTDDEAAQIAALRSLRRMLADAETNFTKVAKLIRVPKPAHLEMGAPIDADNLGRLLALDYERLPLADLPALGAILRRLRGGQQPRPDEIQTIQRVRQHVAGLSP